MATKTEEDIKNAPDHVKLNNPYVPYNASGTTVKNPDGVIEVIAEEDVSYPNYLPTWDTNLNLPPWEDFDHVDPGTRADPKLLNLFPKGGDYQKSDLTPKFGTEVHGIQLSKLSDKAKDELALYVAQRGVVAFRNQDLADLPIPEALEFGQYFGRHHVHPASGMPKGFPEIHLVHRARGEEPHKLFETRTSSVGWHTDVSYEKQPPGTTFLYLLDGPSSGGDTVFSDQFEAYDRLSDGFKQRLHGLRALHSGYEQYENALRVRGHVRRAPVANYHPVVRTHPAVNRKALYVNKQFTRNIEGFKKEESDAILNFLYDHTAKGTDFQVRVKWAKGTVVVWDNRRATHSGLLDFPPTERRHLARITPQAEKPYETPFEA